MNVLALLLVPWLVVGERLAVRCWPGRMPWSLRAGLAFALGTTAAGSLLLVARRLGMNDGALTWLNLAAIAVAAFAVTRMPSASRSEPEPVVPAAPVLLRVVLAVAIVTVAVGFCLEVVRFPMGGIDAIAMWTVRARILAIDAMPWSLRLDGIAATPQANYPLLFPAVLAHVTPPNEVTWLPSAMLAACYTAGLIALLHGFMRVVAGPSVAILATLFLLATSRVWKVGAQQFADVPVGFYGTAAVGCLFVALRRSTFGRSVTWIVGLLLGAAASTKDEGQVLATAVVVGTSVALWAGERRRDLLRIGGRIAFGAAPLIAMLISYRLGNPAINLFAVSPPGESIAKLFDLGRHWSACTTFLSEIAQFGGGILFLAPLLLPLTWRLGQRADPDYLEGRRLLSVVLVVLFGLYHVAFVVTPHGQRWHVVTAASRLLTQIFPMILLLICPLYPWATGLVARERCSVTAAGAAEPLA